MHVGTNLCDDFGSEFVDLSWESEPRQGNGEVNALFAVVDARVDFFDSERAESRGDPLSYRPPEGVKSAGRLVCRGVSHFRARV